LAFSPPSVSPSSDSQHAFSLSSRGTTKSSASSYSPGYVGVSC
jgi:hypothetical protein